MAHSGYRTAYGVLVGLLPFQVLFFVEAPLPRGRQKLAEFRAGDEPGKAGEIEGAQPFDLRWGVRVE